MKTGRLSVVMPAYNAADFIDASVRSILEQTHSEFELLIRDDCSTDGTLPKLRAWARRDSRIELIEGADRLGIVGNSNWVWEHAGGSLIARMDADDISAPDRLRRQLEVLDRWAEIDLVGTLGHAIGRTGQVVRPPEPWRLGRRSGFAPFPYASLMVRAEALRRVGGYRERCSLWEDVDLFLRLARHGRIAVLSEALYQYRYASGFGPVSRELMVATDLMYRCVDEYEAGRSYEHLLAEADVTTAEFDPRAVRYRAALRIWSGGKTRIQGQVQRASSPRRTLPDLRTFAWSALASASPRATLVISRFLVLMRNIRFWALNGRAELYIWLPGHPSVPVRGA